MNDSLPLAKFVSFALVCVGFAAWIILLIGNITIGGDRVDYEAVFSNVSGLLANDSVLIAGVEVGKVNAIEVIDGSTALVKFQADRDVRLGDETKVSIKWRDAIGLRFLYLEPAGDGDLQPGHRFPVTQTIPPANIGTFIDDLTPVMNALDPDVANVVIRAFAEALVGREQEVRDLIRDGGSLTAQLATRDQQLQRLLVNSADILDAYAAQEDNLDGLLDSFADVATTLANRNDELIRAITTLDDAQDEFARLVERNDAEIRLALDALDRATAVLAVNRDRFEEVLATTSLGFGSYHRISNIGQYFNVRGVGFSVDYETVPNSSYRGAELPPRRGGDGGESGTATQSSAGPGRGLSRIFGGAALVARGGA